MGTYLMTKLPWFLKGDGTGNACFSESNQNLSFVTGTHKGACVLRPKHYPSGSRTSLMHQGSTTTTLKCWNQPTTERNPARIDACVSVVHWQHLESNSRENETEALQTELTFCSFQSGISSLSARGSNTFPDSMCAPATLKKNRSSRQSSRLALTNNGACNGVRTSLQRSVQRKGEVLTNFRSFFKHTHWELCALLLTQLFQPDGCC